jgi:hypothetical protein
LKDVLGTLKASINFSGGKEFLRRVFKNLFSDKKCKKIAG